MKYQEICMEQTHSRSKCKREFKGVLNKVLVSGLILATVLGSSTTAFAANTDNVIDTNAVKITSEYGVSVASAISEIRNTINAINLMRQNGTVSDSFIKTLASQIYALETAATSDGSKMDEVASVLSAAESSVKGLSNASEAEVAIAIVRGTLGIDSVSVDNKNAPDNKNDIITGFSDIGDYKWAEPYIMSCVQHGAIAGTTTPVNGIGTFNPGGKVTLSQFITVLTRLIAADKIDSSLAGSGVHWAMPNYSAAIDIGLIYSYEYSSSKADLEKQLTREEMAVMLSRAAEINGEPLEILPGIENNIGDLDKVSSDKVTAVKQAYSCGLLAGTNDNGDFAPKNTMTRAEMATVVCRLMNYVPRGEVTIKDPETNVEESKSEYVVTESAETQGMLRPAVSREYELKALGATRTGEDANGVYVTFTAPQLPSEIANDFTINMSADVCKSNGDYFADPISVTLKSGETKKVYFNSYSGGKVTKGEIGSMAISVYIYANGDVSKSMFTRSIYSDVKGTANATKYSGSLDTATLDSSAVWAGLGL